MDSKSKTNGDLKSDCRRGTVQQLASYRRLVTTSKDNKKNLKVKEDRGSSRAHSAAAGIKYKGMIKKYYHLRPQQPIPPNVQVCPINVGQGDSILLKLQYIQGMLYLEISYTLFVQHPSVKISGFRYAPLVGSISGGGGQLATHFTTPPRSAPALIDSL